MSRFREKCVTDRQTDGWIDKGTQGHIGPFHEAQCKITDVCQAPKYTKRMPKII